MARGGAAIIAASHTAELAERWGRRTRNLIAEHSAVLGYGLSADSQAAGRWETTNGGEYFAAGVGVAITGRPVATYIIALICAVVTLVTIVPVAGAEIVRTLAFVPINFSLHPFLSLYTLFTAAPIGSLCLRSTLGKRSQLSRQPHN